MFVASSLVFLAVINREFLLAFTSKDTAATYNRKWFSGIRDGDHESKSQVFGVHPVYRKSFEKEICEWTMNGWERFEQEQPAWFTERWIDSMPNNTIPYKYCVKYCTRRRRGGKRRDGIR